MGLRCVVMVSLSNHKVYVTTPSLGQIKPGRHQLLFGPKIRRLENF